MTKELDAELKAVLAMPEGREKRRRTLLLFDKLSEEYARETKKEEAKWDAMTEEERRQDLMRIAEEFM